MLRKILYSFVIFPCIVWAQTAEMTPKQVREDMNFLIKNIDEISVEPYRKISRENFVLELQNAEKSIVKKPIISNIDLYKAFQPVIVTLEDGHTELNISDDIAQTDYLIFPFSVRVSEEGVFIKSIKSTYKESVTGDLTGKKITEIITIFSWKKETCWKLQ
ncbi:hypothetical protein [Chryseobacterium sp. c4a]|uniref:hypothetical protein n=1 Tax=Chryseobacterium sp. c4a TaxID=1573582 RepID=UPI00135CF02E|nr:hypothetical protein [Chryseobacterium sp. c4a]